MSRRGSTSGPVQTPETLQQRLIVDGLRYAARKAEKRGRHSDAAQLRFVACLTEENPAELERGRQWLIAAERSIR